MPSISSISIFNHWLEARLPFLIDIFTALDPLRNGNPSFLASAILHQMDLMPAACGYAYWGARWDQREAEVGQRSTNGMQVSSNAL